jgi:hypothetical protein
MAQQRGRTFSPYPVAGVSGETVELLHIGSHSAAAMLAAEQDSNAIIKWVLRAVGFFLMWFGLILTSAPLSAIANIIPFLGSIVSTCTYIACAESSPL